VYILNSCSDFYSKNNQYENILIIQTGGISMRLEKVQEALKTKNIHYEYTEENGCGSLDFMFRGLRFHVWEYEDRVWGAETNVFEAGRSQDIEGDYEEIISKEILSWPDMMPGM
jgi:hypothetical protein